MRFSNQQKAVLRSLSETEWSTTHDVMRALDRTPNSIASIVRTLLSLETNGFVQRLDSGEHARTKWRRHHWAREAIDAALGTVRVEEPAKAPSERYFYVGTGHTGAATPFFSPKWLDCDAECPDFFFAIEGPFVTHAGALLFAHSKEMREFARRHGLEHLDSYATSELPSFGSLSAGDDED